MTALLATAATLVAGWVFLSLTAFFSHLLCGAIVQGREFVVEQLEASLEGLGWWGLTAFALSGIGPGLMMLGGRRLLPRRWPWS